VIERHFDIRIGTQAFQKELCGFELFALHDERMLRVVTKNRMVELREELLARPIPELKGRRDQADARHIMVEAVLAQQIERRRMRCRSARVGLQAAIIVEQPNRQSAPAEEPGAKQPDRSAAGDQDSTFLIGHARSLANGARRRDMAGAGQRFLDRIGAESEERRYLPERDLQ
jgi:hypothetical protein